MPSLPKDFAWVGTVVTPGGLRYLQTSSCPADLIEVRLDALLAARAPIENVEKALKQRRRPVLLTLRSRKEGGCYSWKARERERWFLRLLPFTDAVDLELAEIESMGAVVKEARRLGKALVLSVHLLKKPATAVELRKLAQAMKKHSAHAYKIAARIKDPKKDARLLAGLLFERPEEPWALMGIGPHADLSRRVFVLLGSKLAYGYLDKPAAPGQPSIRELRKSISF